MKEGDVKRDYYMLLLFLFVFLLFFVFVFFIVCFFSFHLFLLLLLLLSFFRDSNMISISKVEFRYYVVIIILVNLGKP